MDITFRTFSDNGLLLYGGVGEDDDRDETDFISVSIVDKFIEFAFDLGGGEVVLRSTKPVVLGNIICFECLKYYKIGNYTLLVEKTKQLFSE